MLILSQTRRAMHSSLHHNLSESHNYGSSGIRVERVLYLSFWAKRRISGLANNRFFASLRMTNSFPANSWRAERIWPCRRCTGDFWRYTMSITGKMAPENSSKGFVLCLRSQGDETEKVRKRGTRMWLIIRMWHDTYVCGARFSPPPGSNPGEVIALRLEG